MQYTLQKLNVLVINMDIKTDRLDKISKKLSDFNIYFERITGYEPNEEEIKNNKLINPTKIYKRWIDNGIYIKGVLGCKISHINAIKRAEELEGYTLILEDDVFFEDDAMEIFEKAWIQLQQFEWDIFYLGANIRGNSQLVSDNIIKTTNAVSFCAYIVNRKSYSNIIEIIEKSEIEVDSAVAEASLRNDIKQYVINPMIVYVEDDFSSNTEQHTYIRWRDR